MISQLSMLRRTTCIFLRQNGRLLCDISASLALARVGLGQPSPRCDMSCGFVVKI
jgi:hypothetical protein